MLIAVLTDHPGGQLLPVAKVNLELLGLPLGQRPALFHVARRSAGFSVSDSDLCQDCFLSSVAQFALFLVQYSFLTKLSGEKANKIAKTNLKIVIASDVFKSIMSTIAVMMNGAFCSYIQCCFECTTKI